MREEILSLDRFCKTIAQQGILGEPMSRHTTFEIGGPAELFVEVTDTEKASLILKEAQKLGVRVTIVGRGSDLLVSDDGIKGLVLKLSEQMQPQLVDETTIVCPAGVCLKTLCEFAAEQGLTGLEFAYGIPGSVGGAVYMNAGAYDGEIKDVVEMVCYYTPQGGSGTLDAGQLDFSYRHSWFTDHPGHLIAQVRVCLKKGNQEQIYKKMKDLHTRRYTKQPMEYPSAGSTFKRPQGGYASALIDQCGLKGERIGGAMVSEKHAGFIINYENATCKEVQKLIAHVQKTVQEKTGFSLECEVKYLE